MENSVNKYIKPVKRISSLEDVSEFKKSECIGELLQYILEL